MLIIREAQMEAFRAANDSRLVEWLARHVRRHDPEVLKGLEERLIRGRLHAALVRTRRHGISDPLSLAEFFMAMAVHSPTFDEVPAIQRILAHPDLPADVRIHAVWQRVTPEVWEEAARRPVPIWWTSPEKGISG